MPTKEEFHRALKIIQEYTENLNDTEAEALGGGLILAYDTFTLTGETGPARLATVGTPAFLAGVVSEVVHFSPEIIEVLLSPTANGCKCRRCNSQSSTTMNAENN